jgi:hypothetical protein
MPPNVPRVKGRAAIEQYYMKLFSGGTKVGQFALTHLESRAVGDSGYDVGTYQQSMNPPSQTTATSDTGKYVVILRRSQGAWRWPTRSTTAIRRPLADSAHIGINTRDGCRPSSGESVIEAPWRHAVAPDSASLLDRAEQRSSLHGHSGLLRASSRHATTDSSRTAGAQRSYGRR